MKKLKEQIKTLENQQDKLLNTIDELNRQIRELKDRNIQLVAKMNVTVANLTGTLNELVK